VLGPEYVKAAKANASPFAAEMQDYLAENCWGLVWDREGLDRRARSLVTLTALASGSKWSEFATHVRGAIRNGVTETELREAIFQMAVYLGVPTAVEAFRVASGVLEKATVG